jgi:hypothetical protein
MNEGQTPSTSLMFSKFLLYTRNILTSQLPASLADTETNALQSNPTMVTTRRQTSSNSDPAVDVFPALESLPQDAPSASSEAPWQPQAENGQTSLAAQDGSASVTTRKIQKLPVREMDEQHFERHAHIAIEIPVRDITQGNTPMWTTSQQGTPKGKRSLTEDTPSNLNVQRNDIHNGEEPEDGYPPIPMAQDAVGEDTTLPDTSEKTSRRRGRNMKFSSRLEKNVKSTPEPARVVYASRTVKSKHKRFDSEEPVVEEFDQVVEEEAKIEEDESSDDDAPEVVTTYDAQEKVIVTARSTAKAVEQYVSKKFYDKLVTKLTLSQTRCFHTQETKRTRCTAQRTGQSCK